MLDATASRVGGNSAGREPVRSSENRGGQAIGGLRPSVSDTGLASWGGALAAGGSDGMADGGICRRGRKSIGTRRQGGRRGGGHFAIGKTRAAVPGQPEGEARRRLWKARTVVGPRSSG